ncbi:MAG: N-acetyltransferase [Acidiferrobacterales bacterium]
MPGIKTAVLVRPANIHDVIFIYDLVDSYAHMGNLLPRPMSELYRHLRDFFVIVKNDKVVGCGALEIFTETLGEVRSLVVAEDQTGQGFGKKLVRHIVEEASVIGLKQIMALTYMPEFFHTLGFRTVKKNTLPEKVWGICIKCYKFNNCDETAVVIDI